MKDASVAVIGVGGCGCNNVRLLAQAGFASQANLFALNTDIVSHQQDGIAYIQIGEQTTRGLGAGALPQVGEAAALESSKQLEAMISGYDLIVLTAGLGGGTGSGALPVIAKLIEQANILTCSIVTLPFEFEGKKRMQQAQTALQKITRLCNAIQVIQNNLLRSTFGGKTTLLECFKQSNQANLTCLSGVVDILTKVSLINLDMNDVKAVLAEPSFVHINQLSFGQQAIGSINQEQLINPLALHAYIGRSHAALVQINAGSNFNLQHLQTIGDIIQQHIADDALLIIGLHQTEEAKEDIEVFFILSGAQESEPKFDLNVSTLVNDKFCR